MAVEEATELEIRQLVRAYEVLSDLEGRYRVDEMYDANFAFAREQECVVRALDALADLLMAYWLRDSIEASRAWIPE